MKTNLIGIHGKARSGKDTAAAVIADYFGGYINSFATPIKQALKVILNESELPDDDKKEGIIPDLGVTYRYLMQTLGTEWGRQLINPDIWVKIAERRVRNIKRLHKRGLTETFAPLRLFVVVFPDVRFDNEAKWIRKNGGAIIHVVRRDCPEVNAHSSEAGITPDNEDFVLYNRASTVDEFRGDVAELCARGISHYINEGSKP